MADEKKKRISKKSRILNYMENGNTITQLEATQLFGATRLSAIIFDLKHKDNKNILSIPCCVIDRYGEKCNVVKYKLVTEGDA